MGCFFVSKTYYNLYSWASQVFFAINLLLYFCNDRVNKTLRLQGSLTFLQALKDFTICEFEQGPKVVVLFTLRESRGHCLSFVVKGSQ